MKRISISLLLTLICAALAAQSAPCDFAKLMREGRDSLQAKKYQGALKKFNAARTCDRDKSPEVDKAVDAVFRAIEGEKEEALRQKKRAEEARRQADVQRRRAEGALAGLEIQKARTDSALQKAEKLINAFYFYADRFALAFKDNQFYFIDKNGDPVKKLGEYDKAEQFDELGFAKVTKDGGKDYLLDTFGTTYRSAYSLTEFVRSVTAIDLRGRRLDSFPREILRYSLLEILILNGTYGEPYNRGHITLPPTISNLFNLKSLHFSFCGLDTLPTEIGQLDSLQTIDFSHNEFKVLPPEIGQLKNLQLLNVSQNQLNRLPTEIGQLESLRSLSLAQNQINALPLEIGQLKNLQSLDLFGNDLSSLPAEIRLLKSLKKLDLERNPFPSDYIEQLRKDMPWCEIKF